MNVFEEAQMARPQIEGADENIAAARSRLAAEMHAPQATVTSGVRRRWIIAGSAMAGAAAVAAGAILVGTLAAPAPTPTAEAIPTGAPSSPAPPPPTPEPTVEPLTVSSAFAAAGASASDFSGLTVAPGQYLRMQASVHGLVFYEPVNGWGEYSADRSNATNAWGVANSYDVYVPADQHGEWRYLAGPGQITDLYGPDAGRLSEQYRQETEQGGYDPYGQAGGAGAPWPTANGDSLVAFLESMPKDPAQLIAWIDDHQDTPPESDDSKVGWLLIDLLARNGGPSDARAAMYAALSMLDGFELTSVAGEDFTVALTTPTEDLMGNPTTVRRTATIDMGTGLVEETTVTTGAGSPLVADSVPDMTTTYSLSVVDTAP